MECVKCKESTNGGTAYIEDHKLYQFCKKCADILETFPIPTNMIYTFLKADLNELDWKKNPFVHRIKRLKSKNVDKN